jgi:ribosomal protein S18 acetylase RimI-like enzyme
MIKQLDISDLPLAAEVIRASFATVAKDFNITKENCPSHTSFVTTPERLRQHIDRGWQLYGLYDETGITDEHSSSLLAGYVSLSKKSEDIYELHNLAVLPECRRKGYGRQLLDFCKAKVKEQGGNKITLGIIEENTVLKNWYAANGFVHTGMKWFKHLPFIVGYMEWEG